MRRSFLCAVSQLSTTVDVGILLVCCGSCQEFVLDADAACSHFDDGCTAVQAGDVNTRRPLSLGSAGQ